jgi:hypothetical protein
VHVLMITVLNQVFLAAEPAARGPGQRKMYEE